MDASEQMEKYANISKTLAEAQLLLTLDAIAMRRDVIREAIRSLLRRAEDRKSNRNAQDLVGCMYIWWYGSELPQTTIRHLVLK